jgi:imidazolonepropionase-like amidohydrolase
MNRRTRILLTGMTLLGLAALPQLGFAQSDPFVEAAIASPPAQTRAEHYPATVLQASHLLDVGAGSIVSPGVVLVDGERIVAAGASVEYPPGAEVINLGDVTLMPGLIDAHVHLFLHPGAEDLQTIKESVPQRTILATLAARADLMAGFTTERDMGTEGARSMRG